MHCLLLKRHCTVVLCLTSFTEQFLNVSSVHSGRQIFVGTTGSSLSTGKRFIECRYSETQNIVVIWRAVGIHNSLKALGTFFTYFSISLGQIKSSYQPSVQSRIYLRPLLRAGNCATRSKNSSRGCSGISKYMKFHLLLLDTHVRSATRQWHSRLPDYQ